MSGPGATIFVCVSCRRQRNDLAEGFDRPGVELAAALKARVAEAGASGIIVEAVDCLAVCKRPCTLALAGRDKWTYLVGDLDSVEHVNEIVAAAEAYARSDNGIVPWKERPQAFRKGVVARVPPLGFAQPLTETT
ncbi:MAG: DUF1636 domain-containing protein [Hyphomicrobium sp.]